jgi:hypothetical protein
MKNIHVLPTDKPSRLFFNNNKFSKKFELTKGRPFLNGITNTQNHNIYITNSEEIKEGDWGLSKLNEVILFGRSYNEKFYKKIILTTDQDLIKNGVQPIENEFLEWFVKNPSCESVEIKNNGKIGVFSDGSVSVIYSNYKIIIPKEEPKQDLRKYPLTPDECFKQETLKEVAEIWVHNRFTKQIKDEDIYASESSIVQSHILFAKWQMERSYSEEEVKNIVDETIEKFYKHFYTLTKAEMKEKWFEQFKKK